MDLTNNRRATGSRSLANSDEVYRVLARLQNEVELLPDFVGRTKLTHPESVAAGLAGGARHQSWRLGVRTKNPYAGYSDLALAARAKGDQYVVTASDIGIDERGDAEWLHTRVLAWATKHLSGAQSRSPSATDALKAFYALEAALDDHPLYEGRINREIGPGKRWSADIDWVMFIRGFGHEDSVITVGTGDRYWCANLTFRTRQHWYHARVPMAELTPLVLTVLESGNYNSLRPYTRHDERGHLPSTTPG